MSVYKAINAVQAELAKAGISKDSTNTFDNYKFRGIDAVYNSLSPLLAKHGLCILPRMLSRSVAEHQSQKGGVLYYVTVEAEFDFVAAVDGSKHTVKTFGEAMDRGDKGTNKAMSAAYKYAAFQAFAIPTEGDNDADASTHEVVASLVPALEASIEQAKQRRAGVMEAVLRDLDLDAKTVGALNKLATEVGVAFKQEPALAYDRIEIEELNNDEKTYLWSLLPSPIRSALKRERQTRAMTKETV